MNVSVSCTDSFMSVLTPMHSSVTGNIATKYTELYVTRSLLPAEGKDVQYLSRTDKKKTFTSASYQDKSIPSQWKNKSTTTPNKHFRPDPHKLIRCVHELLWCPNVTLLKYNIFNYVLNIFTQIHLKSSSLCVAVAAPQYKRHQRTHATCKFSVCNEFWVQAFR